MARVGADEILPDGLGEVERIVLSADDRGIARVARALPPDFCGQAARLVRDNGERVMLVTGFYVNGAPETDGPPGAAALGHALSRLGAEVTMVTDAVSQEVLRAITPPAIRCVEFPTVGEAKSAKRAEQLLAEINPTAIGFIERPGPTAKGVYLNRGKEDITKFCGLTHHLLDGEIPSFGVGDGGNEMGMGAYGTVLVEEGVLPEPCVSVVDETVIASISNWGALGIVAELARMTDEPLLPHPEMEEARLRAMVRLGAVDGGLGENLVRVDGRDLGEYLRVLTELRQLVGQRGEIS
ncbi:MAG: DUF4392 domain-containing protein [Chloroflexota bacterium]|nr:DUF4392 domain-containing protein [Chloroflexota bacterium]MDP6758500.1 DUF4392 domain-containing protein [Chloroflexota bacterium]